MGGLTNGSFDRNGGAQLQASAPLRREF